MSSDEFINEDFIFIFFSFRGWEENLIVHLFVPTKCISSEEDENSIESCSHRISASNRNDSINYSLQ